MDSHFLICLNEVDSGKMRANLCRAGLRRGRNVLPAIHSSYRRGCSAEGQEEVLLNPGT
jgi:hypothetical protein